MTDSNTLQESRIPPVVLVIDSPIATPDFRAYRLRRLIDGITRTSFVWVLSLVSVGFKLLQVTVNTTALCLSSKDTSQSPFRLFIFVYTLFVAAHGLSFVYRHWGYLVKNEPLEFSQGAESTLFNNLLDIFTLFLYFIGFKWLQEYQSEKDKTPLLYYLTKVWVFYGIVVLLAPIFSVVLILILLNYIKPSLPVLEYTPGGKISEEDAQCTICLTPYANKEKIRRLPCKHHFHMACIDEWFGIDDLCPLCKRPVNPLYDIVGSSI
ncbi:hypothetical protein NEHOM01_0455 [Nematocida homosporus]|uniref:uncharacterized protein n=1 Tax=Nematocida homosporus TaxID=1912981 RepID=UPI00221F0D07|nr:uncharacterized protein NEHOM01_0455 [Nematocida homosporus]KAI5184904.1 hypothetical protein NEHOM01_0455 [Nematocida homosporus]